MHYHQPLTLLASLCLTASVDARFLMYYDQWHTTRPTDASVRKGIDHVVLAFAPSTGPASYTPFTPISTIKSEFGSSTKVSIAVGGWGDNSGFDQASQTDTSRKAFASAVAQMLTSTGADGVDIDWEYPGGNGADYKTNPNSGKVGEIQSYALTLQAIRAAIGPNKLLSIAVPGLARDMIAFTAQTGPQIWPSVDYINLMSYDLMNRRDNITKHHTSVQGSLEAVNNYLAIGAPASKINLGFAYYAKWFTTAGDCGSQPLGCPTAVLENPSDGSDTGLSGAVTFESNREDSIPANVLTSWSTAQANGKLDSAAGGMYYFDAGQKIFWTWDTPTLIAQKFSSIVKAKALGGVMAWSLGEDSQDWSHIKAMSAGVSS